MVTVGDIGHARGRQSDPEQHRSRRRSAVGLPAGDEAGRRHQHHRRRRRRQDASSDSCSTCRRSSRPTSCSISRCSSSAPSRRCCDEGGIGLALTGLMVLVFLGSFRATVGVFLSIPLSVLAAFILLYAGGASINTMILAGFALVFSRLIDNAVIVLENIYPAPRARRAAGGSGGARRRRSVDGGARRDADQLGRVLSGDVPLRRQPVPLLGAGAGRRAGALRLVLRRDDGGAALLRALHEGAGAHASSPGHPELDSGAEEGVVGDGARRRAIGARGWRSRGCRGWSASTAPSATVRAAAALVRARVRVSLRRPGLVVVGRIAGFSASLAALSRLLGVVVLPAYRRRPVRDQHEVAVGHAHRGDLRRRSPKSRRSSSASSTRPISS